EPIIADITLGSVDGERANALTGSTCNNVGQVDQPGVSHGGCGGAGRYGSATWDEWLPKLVIGRAYHFNIQTSVDRQVVEKAFLIIDDWRQRTNPCPDPSTCDNYFFIATLYDSVLYGHQLVSLIKGETSDMPLPPGGFTGATMYAFPPLVDVTGPAVVIAVEPDCDECSGVVTLFESASPRMPILVLELNEAEAQRLDIDTFPTVLIVDENGAMLTRPAVGEFTPEQAESLISTACVLLGGCGPVEG
ncbi:MAG: hypothetical protein O7C01_01630, partial [Actinobacteria bacterium]|nr:hypothetical protein [Actinomycetota bacterium]